MTTRKANLTAPDWFFIDFEDDQYHVYFGERDLSDPGLSEYVATFALEQDAIDYVEWGNDNVAAGMERERSNDYDNSEDDEGYPAGYDNEAQWEELV
jgi:hypothetical protein